MQSGSAKKPKSAVSDSDSEGEIVDDTLSAAGSDEDLLEEIDKDLDDCEETVPPVSTSLAQIINKRFQSGLSEDKLKIRLDRYKRPENCEALQTPRVNPEIWKTLPADARRSDIKSSHVQKALTKAAMALTDSTQTLLRAQRNSDAKTSKKLKTAIEKNTDALALMGHASHQLSIKRRQAIRTHLHPTITGICNDSVPVTKWLFGDNLASSIKEMREMDKLGNAIASGGKQLKYKTQMYPYKSSSAFLANRNGQWARQRGRMSHAGQKHRGAMRGRGYNPASKRNWQA